MDGNPNAISEQAVLGVDLFRSQARGQCITCHEGAELTGASVRQVLASPTRIRDGQATDRGFNNIGVLETLQDISLGAKDNLGNWLSTVKRLSPAPRNRSSSMEPSKCQDYGTWNSPHRISTMAASAIYPQ